MLNTYSPISPRKKSWIPPKTKIETIIVGIPGVMLLSTKITKMRVINAPTMPKNAMEKPARSVSLAGILLVETNPFIP